MSDKPAESPAPDAKKEVKILIVDDDKVTTHLLEAKFQAAGYTVDCANTGKDALDKLKAAKPNAVILDVLMPGVGGYQLFSYLKEDETFKDVAVFVMSARRKMGDTFTASGVEDFFVKPFKVNEMIAKVASRTGGPAPEIKDESLSDEQAKEAALQPGQEPASAEQAPAAEAPKPASEAPKPAAAPAASPVPPPEAPPPAAAKKTVMIAGDSKAAVSKMSAMLAEKDCQAAVIEDSKQLLAKAKELKPNIIITDILLNKFPAHETIRRLHRQPETKTTKIIAYSCFDKEGLGDGSSHQRKLDIESAKALCIDAGVDLFIGEFSPEQFLTVVQVIVK